MVGKDKKYGLPKNSTIERYEKIGTKLHRTDINGSIEVTSNGKDIKVKTEK